MRSLIRDLERQLDIARHNDTNAADSPPKPSLIVDELAKNIVALAESYQLASSLTSFLVVEERDTAAEGTMQPVSKPHKGIGQRLLEKMGWVPVRYTSLAPIQTLTAIVTSHQRKMPTKERANSHSLSHDQNAVGWAASLQERVAGM